MMRKSSVANSLNSACMKEGVRSTTTSKKRMASSYNKGSSSMGPKALFTCCTSMSVVRRSSPHTSPSDHSTSLVKSHVIEDAKFKSCSDVDTSYYDDKNSYIRSSPGSSGCNDKSKSNQLVATSSAKRTTTTSQMVKCREKDVTGHFLADRGAACSASSETLVGDTRINCPPTQTSVEPTPGEGKVLSVASHRGASIQSVAKLNPCCAHQCGDMNSSFQKVGSLKNLSREPDKSPSPMTKKFRDSLKSGSCLTAPHYRAIICVENLETFERISTACSNMGIEVVPTFNDGTGADSCPQNAACSLSMKFSAQKSCDLTHSHSNLREVSTDTSCQCSSSLNTSRNEDLILGLQDVDGTRDSGLGMTCGSINFSGSSNEKLLSSSCSVNQTICRGLPKAVLKFSSKIDGEKKTSSRDWCLLLFVEESLLPYVNLNVVTAHFQELKSASMSSEGTLNDDFKHWSLHPVAVLNQTSSEQFQMATDVKKSTEQLFKHGYKQLIIKNTHLAIMMNQIASIQQNHAQQLISRSSNFPPPKCHNTPAILNTLSKLALDETDDIVQITEVRIDHGSGEIFERLVFNNCSAQKLLIESTNNATRNDSLILDSIDVVQEKFCDGSPSLSSPRTVVPDDIVFGEDSEEDKPGRDTATQHPVLDRRFQRSLQDQPFSKARDASRSKSSNRCQPTNCSQEAMCHVEEESYPTHQSSNNSHDCGCNIRSVYINELAQRRSWQGMVRCFSSPAGDSILLESKIVPIFPDMINQSKQDEMKEYGGEVDPNAESSEYKTVHTTSFFALHVRHVPTLLSAHISHIRVQQPTNVSSNNNPWSSKPLWHFSDCLEGNGNHADFIASALLRKCHQQQHHGIMEGKQHSSFGSSNSPTSLSQSSITAGNRRISTIKQNSSSIHFETPISRVIKIIVTAQQAMPLYVAQSLDKVLEILGSTEVTRLFSPDVATANNTSMDSDDTCLENKTDPVTSDLLGALLSNTSRDMVLKRRFSNDHHQTGDPLNTASSNRPLGCSSSTGPTTPRPTPRVNRSSTSTLPPLPQCVDGKRSAAQSTITKEQVQKDNKWSEDSRMPDKTTDSGEAEAEIDKAQFNNVNEKDVIEHITSIDVSCSNEDEMTMASESTLIDIMDHGSWEGVTFSDEVKDVLSWSDQWNAFDIIRLEELTSQSCLTTLGYTVFRKYEADKILNCDSKTIYNWLCLMEIHYHKANAYHNSTHAADVMHAIAHFMDNERVKHYFSPLDQICCLIAAVMHDVDHPGTNSAFLCNSGSELALLYNDITVLENHHAAFGFKITVEQDSTNIFGEMTSDDYKLMRGSVVDMILATDMSKHYVHVNNFASVFVRPHVTMTSTNTIPHDRVSSNRVSTCCEDNSERRESSSSTYDQNLHGNPPTNCQTTSNAISNQNNNGTLPSSPSPTTYSRSLPTHGGGGLLTSTAINTSPTNTCFFPPSPLPPPSSAENVSILRRMLIKCADVSNPARPLHLCKEWAIRIAEEYFKQTEEEQRLGLPVVMPQFDRKTCSIPKSQLGFFKFFIFDMFEMLDGFCSFPELIDIIMENHTYWKKEATEITTTPVVSGISVEANMTVKEQTQANVGKTAGTSENLEEAAIDAAASAT